MQNTCSANSQAKATSQWTRACLTAHSTGLSTLKATKRLKAICTLNANRQLKSSDRLPTRPRAKFRLTLVRATGSLRVTSIIKRGCVGSARCEKSIELNEGTQSSQSGRVQTSMVISIGPLQDSAFNQEGPGGQVFHESRPSQQSSVMLRPERLYRSARNSHLR